MAFRNHDTPLGARGCSVDQVEAARKPLTAVRVEI